jgi:hypothetical protein
MTEPTDRELLEAAAKAVGMPLTDNDVRDHGQWEWLFLGDRTWGFFQNNANGSQRKWNPLTDDGDALRLSVKLHIQIAPDEANKMATAFLVNVSDCEPREETICVELWRDGADPYAATRRAIVRAAAAIGGKHD